MNLAVVIELLCFLVDVNIDRGEGSGCLTGLPFCIEVPFCKKLPLPTREEKEEAPPPIFSDTRPERRPRGFRQSPLRAGWAFRGRGRIK